MAGRDEKIKEILKQQELQKKAAEKKLAKRTTLEAKHRAKKHLVSEKFKALRKEVMRIYNFDVADKKNLSRAFGLKLENLSSQQIISKISSFSIEKLREAEDNVEGTGARLFARLKVGESLEMVPYGYQFKEGDKLVISFPSKEAEDYYGMRTLFKNQPEIRKVRIKQNGPRCKGKEGLAQRNTYNGNFYFIEGDYKGQYAPIVNQTEVDIVERIDKKDKKIFKKGFKFFKFGKDKRGINEEGIKFFEERYGIEAPLLRGIMEEWQNYFKLIDKGTENKFARKRKSVRPKLSRQEFIPKTEIERRFHEKWNEIQTINDPERLIAMRNEIEFHRNDPLVYVPGERRGIKLRTGAALRYALFKRHAKLNGVDVRITSGYRSTKRQEKLWFYGLAKRMRMFRRKYPNMSEYELRKRAERLNARYVARPGRSHHNTGGAVDIALYESGTRKRIESYKFRASRSAYNYALRIRDLSRLRGNDRKAVETRIFMDDKLKASYFLVKNYFAETWHWNMGKGVYRNV